MAKRRLNSRTRGLLDVYGDRIDYLHRTARDWVLENWEMINNQKKPDFNPYLDLLKAFTIQVSAIADNAAIAVSFDCDDFWDGVQLLFAFANLARHEALELPTLLDRIDFAFTKVSQTKIYNKSYKFLRNINTTGSHWSVQASPNPHSCLLEDGISQLWFVAFCAKFPLVPYVRAKISANLFLTQPKSPQATLLENAAFGFLQESEGPHQS